MPQIEIYAKAFWCIQFRCSMFNVCACIRGQTHGFFYYIQLIYLFGQIKSKHAKYNRKKVP